MARLEHVVIAALVISALAMSAMLLSSWGDAAALRAGLNASEAGLAREKARADEADSEITRLMADLAASRNESGALSGLLAAERNRSSMLEDELGAMEEELADARQTLAESREEIGQIRDETEEMAERINQSIEWFSANAELPSSLRYDRFLSRVRKGCVDGGVLRLACVSYLMEDELGLEYRDDPAGDRLYSIDEIVQRRGGDCEDFSLFFKAALNRLEGEGYSLEAWEGSYGGRYDVYEDKAADTIWYYDNARPRALGDLGPQNRYVACYYYDTSGQEWFGHCVMMLSANDIRAPGDISDGALSDASFFEPQNGEFLGGIGDGFSACAEGDSACGERENAVQFVITDDDLFEFNGGKWSSYHAQLARTAEIIAELDAAG